jgi:threonine/homoserine efflux transporter RhtA
VWSSYAKCFKINSGHYFIVVGKAVIRTYYVAGGLSLGVLSYLSWRRKRRFRWVVLGLLGAYFLVTCSSGIWFGFEELGSRLRIDGGF